MNEIKNLESKDDNSSKLKTIEELKASEERKPKALNSLRDKISDLSIGLTDDEKSILSKLVGGRNESEKKDEPDDKAVFTKPQQSHVANDELDKAIFTKPQQSHIANDELDKAVFTKPQQSHIANDELDKAVFTKPQQSHIANDELDKAVFRDVKK